MATIRKTGTAADAAKQQPSKNRESLRDTVEAVAIAFIMAFVFKTFEAELYVIPTGSMAPTLYGRHKEVDCDGCDFRYTVGASHEVDQDSGIVVRRLSTSICPNCRYRNDILQAPAYNGDRILVNKQNQSFDRFDVVVFKNPEESHVNYIKRCIGLPGETIRIHQGDVFARPPAGGEFAIQRKQNPDVQRDIQIPVYDDRYPPQSLLDAGAEERWVPARRDEAAGEATPWVPSDNGWTPDYEARAYRFEPGGPSQLNWLRYRHLTPSAENWREVNATGRLTAPLTPSLIADFCGFNSYDTVPPMPGRYDGELYWVGDLTLHAVVDIDAAEDSAVLRLQLVEGHRAYSCDLYAGTGRAEIRVSDRKLDRDGGTGRVVATAETPVQGPDRYEITFANVDERLCLWVDGELVPLGDGAEFPATLDPLDPTDEDLAPAGIAARDLTATVSELQIERDIYYRNDTLRFEPSDIRTAAPHQWHPLIEETPDHDHESLAATLRSPTAWADLYRQLTGRQLRGNEAYFTYELADDEYLMCGDNSPASQDSRLFRYYGRPRRGIQSSRFAVREQDLIGEAMFIFWPHGVPFLNGGEGFAVLNHREQRVTENGRIVVVRGEYPSWRFPFYPNFSRMKRIR